MAGGNRYWELASELIGEKQMYLDMEFEISMYELRWPQYLLPNLLNVL